MSKTTLRKVKWTLSFDRELKKMVVMAAKVRGVSPVTMLENLVREKFNPFGHTNVVDDSATYVATLRKQNREQSDADFLAEIEAWHNSGLLLM